MKCRHQKIINFILYTDIITIIIIDILGVGIATMALVFFLDIYYCVIIAWTFFYFIAAFTAIPDLPWNTCGENYFYALIYLTKKI